MLYPDLIALEVVDLAGRGRGSGSLPGLGRLVDKWAATPQYATFCPPELGV